MTSSETALPSTLLTDLPGTTVELEIGGMT